MKNALRTVLRRRKSYCHQRAKTHPKDTFAVPPFFAARRQPYGTRLCPLRDNGQARPLLRSRRAGSLQRAAPGMNSPACRPGLSPNDRSLCAGVSGVLLSDQRFSKMLHYTPRTGICQVPVQLFLHSGKVFLFIRAPVTAPDRLVPRKLDPKFLGFISPSFKKGLCGGRGRAPESPP